MLNFYHPSSLSPLKICSRVSFHHHHHQTHDASSALSCALCNLTNLFLLLVAAASLIIQGSCFGPPATFPRREYDEFPPFSWTCSQEAAGQEELRTGLLTFWFALAGHHHYSSSVSVSLGSLFCCGWRCVGRMPELPFLQGRSFIGAMGALGPRQ